MLIQNMLHLFLSFSDPCQFPTITWKSWELQDRSGNGLIVENLSLLLLSSPTIFVVAYFLHAAHAAPTRLKGLHGSQNSGETEMGSF